MVSPIAWKTYGSGFYHSVRLFFDQEKTHQGDLKKLLCSSDFRRFPGIFRLVYGKKWVDRPAGCKSLQTGGTPYHRIYHFCFYMLGGIKPDLSLKRNSKLQILQHFT